MLKKKFKLFLITLFLLSFTSLSYAQETFLSLKKSKVNVRYGPSFESPIKFIYKKVNLPLKQIDKKENWRRVIDFKNKKTPCIRSFYQEYEISDDILNCEYEGILGTVAGIIGIMQANEILKKILSIGKNLNGQVLVIDLLNLNFRKIKFKKLKDVKKKI